MAISIRFKFPPNLLSNATIRQSLHNVANFIRDLWLARAPHASGKYVRGLMQSNSVKVFAGEIIVTNFCDHAQYYEDGRRAFNIATAILNGGKGVKTAKDGTRYKTIVIKKRPETRFRSPSIATRVTNSFKATFPIGMKAPKVETYGGIKKYKPRKALQNVLKAKQRSDKTILTISEKTLREDPSRWKVPAMQGKKIAEKVQKEGSTYVAEAVRRAIEGEMARQSKMGKSPSWSVPRTPIKPVRR